MGLDFIFIFKAIIIAIVEGITEFIPISSTGHMILVGELIDFHGTEFINMYEVVIQLGAILAIVVLYWKKLLGNTESLFKGEEKGRRFWLMIVVACIPAAILGFLFDDLIDKYLFSAKTVAIGFVVGGILLLVVENMFRNKFNKTRVTKEVEDIGFIQALKVGIFQCLALWPGMSRSASTIMGGWISGISTTAIAEFSFFLGIPIMIGASSLKLLKFKGYAMMTSTQWISLILGFIVAFLVALVCVDGFVSYLKKKPMRVFAIYRIIAGLVLVGLIFLGFIN